MQPLLAHAGRIDNQAMLDRIAIDALLRDPPKDLAAKVAATVGRGRIPADVVAEKCKVSVQAVNGWKKDGRVDKKHIKTLAALTGLPPAWWLPGFDATDAENPPSWPFQKWINIDDLRGLDEGDLGFLAGKLSDALREIRMRNDDKSATARA